MPFDLGQSIQNLVSQESSSGCRTGGAARRPKPMVTRKLRWTSVTEGSDPPGRLGSGTGGGGQVGGGQVGGGQVGGGQVGGGQVGGGQVGGGQGGQGGKSGSASGGNGGNGGNGGSVDQGRNGATPPTWPFVPVAAFPPLPWYYPAPGPAPNAQAETAHAPANWWLPSAGAPWPGHWVCGPPTPAPDLAAAQQRLSERLDRCLQYLQRALAEVESVAGEIQRPGH